VVRGDDRGRALALQFLRSIVTHVTFESILDSRSSIRFLLECLDPALIS